MFRFGSSFVMRTLFPPGRRCNCGSYLSERNIVLIDRFIDRCCHHMAVAIAEDA